MLGPVLQARKRGFINKKKVSSVRDPRGKEEGRATIDSCLLFFPSRKAGLKHGAIHACLLLLLLPAMTPLHNPARLWWQHRQRGASFLLACACTMMMIFSLLALPLSFPRDFLDGRGGEGMKERKNEKKGV